MPRLDKQALGLYLIFGPQDLRDHQTPEALIRAAVAGGVTCLQWRDKTARASAPLPERVRSTEPLQALARALGVPFLINDDVDLAAALQADGVHLGQDDLHPYRARQRLGTGSIIGWSVGTPTERERLDRLLHDHPETIDYIGVGPAFATGTKSDAGAALGAAGINAVVAGLSLPRVAIGGINLDTLPQLAHAQVDGVAVVSALTRSADPKTAAQALRAVHTFVP